MNHEETVKDVYGEASDAGIVFSHESAQALSTEAINAMPATLDDFRCPTCGDVFASMTKLKAHCAAEHPDSVLPEILELHINDRDCQVLIEPHWTLHRALQYRLGLTGTKHMCDRGVCGACTVIMDGRAILACTTLAAECEGAAILTIEGIASDMKWKPLIDAYCKWDAMQCGYCTPGFLVTAKALLDNNPHPTEDEIREALAGNICICGTYPRHSTAILEAAMKISKEA